MRKAALGVGLALLCSNLMGQTYPVRPIRIVVPFPAGGGVDIAARLVGQKLAERLGNGLVVDNRSGASGMVGTEIVARAPADGYTLAMVSASHTINPALYRKMPYDAVKHFAPIGVVVQAPGILVTALNMPARSAQEFIELARARPGQLTFSSAGSGSPPHLAMELLKTMTGIELIHVPYKGGAEYMADVVTGRIDGTITSIAAVMPLLRSGKVRALAVSSKSRAAATPDVPTMIEAGVAGFEYSSSNGVHLPPRAPREVVMRLNAVFNQIVARADMRERLLSMGMEAARGTPAVLGDLVKSDLAKWRKVMDAAGIRPE